MTKRRPSWSDWRGQAVAICCGLLVLQVSMPAAAAAKKSANRPSAVRHHSHKKSPSAPGLRSEAAFGSADVLDDRPGIHGQASFYGSGFHGRRTATGERFDKQAFTAASNRFPLGTQVAVRREDNGRCAIVKVNDRMHARHTRRVIDVSRSVAEYLGMLRAGVVLVRVTPLKGSAGNAAGNACQAAFDFDPELRPEADGQPEKMPEFIPLFGG